MSIKGFLDQAAKLYYEGTPIITDVEFDHLAHSYGYVAVGHSVQGSVAHAFPLYSLQKFYVGEKEPSISGRLIETPKLDGAAISILYIDGIIKLMLTRGDGKRGQDISHLISGLDIPKQLNNQKGVLQITGEIVAPKTIPNARNYAAGALNLKSLEEFKSRDLTFIAYGMYPYQTDNYLEDMHFLNREDFYVVTESDWDIFPQDGLVYRTDDNQDFKSLGYTASHPRGAYALKERSQGVVTTLLDVVWQVGKSGVIAPVAILDPILIGDATVSKATLHNIKYIRELELEIGCQVEVVRSGDVIPRILCRV